MKNIVWINRCIGVIKKFLVLTYLFLFSVFIMRRVDQIKSVNMISKLTIMPITTPFPVTSQSMFLNKAHRVSH